MTETKVIYRFEVLGCKLAVSRLQFNGETRYSKEGIAVWLDAPDGVGGGGTVGFFVEIPAHDYSREGLVEAIQEAAEKRVRELRQEYEDEASLNERRRVQRQRGNEIITKLSDLLSTPK